LLKNDKINIVKDFRPLSSELAIFLTYSGPKSLTMFISS